MKTKIVYIVYTTDIHHSYSSRDIIGIATDESNAQKVCMLDAEKNGETLSAQSWKQLCEMKQTQRHTGACEYQYEGFKTNCLL